MINFANFFNDKLNNKDSLEKFQKNNFILEDENQRLNFHRY